jgi:hypothetical protein
LLLIARGVIVSSSSPAACGHVSGAPFVVGMLLVGARARAHIFSLLTLMRRFVANFCVCREASGDEGMLSASLTLASSHSHVFFSFFGAGLVLVWLFFCLRCALLLCACFSPAVFRFSARFEASAGNLPETRSERQTYIEEKKKKKI